MGRRAHRNYIVFALDGLEDEVVGEALGAGELADGDDAAALTDSQTRIEQDKGERERTQGFRHRDCFAVGFICVVTVMKRAFSSRRPKYAV